jgi:CrcB protein
LIPQQPAVAPDRLVPVSLAVAAGGVLGAEARYAVSRVITHAPSSWPWSTLVINLVGSALLGVLVAVLVGLRRAPRLARPFLGTGVLGGFTTFSGFELDVHSLLRAHRAVLALGYTAVSVVGCVLACFAGGAAARAIRRRRAAEAG